MQKTSLFLLIYTSFYGCLSIAMFNCLKEAPITSKKSVYYTKQKPCSTREKEVALLKNLPQELVAHIVGFLPPGIELYCCACHTAIDNSTASTIAATFRTHALKHYHSALPPFGMSLIPESKSMVFNALLNTISAHSSLYICYESGKGSLYSLNKYIDTLKMSQNISMLQSLLLIQLKSTKEPQNHTATILAKDIPSRICKRLPNELKNNIQLMHIQETVSSLIQKTSSVIATGTGCCFLISISPFLCAYSCCVTGLSSYSDPIYNTNNEYTYIGN